MTSFGMSNRIAVAVALVVGCGSSQQANRTATQPAAQEDPHAGHGMHARHEAHAQHAEAGHGAHAEPGPHAHAGEPGEHAHPDKPGHHAPGGMPHRFEDAEKWAKVFDDPKRDAWQQPDKVIAALGLSRKMSVADVGAGTGYFSVRLARAVPDGVVIATDVEPDMIRYLTERAKRERLPNLRAALTPPDDPELAPASLDRILVVDVWHHLGDRVAYAKRLAAGLKRGGKLAVVDFKLEARQGPPKQHRLAAEAIAADLRAAGLTIGETVDLPEQYIVLATRDGR